MRPDSGDAITVMSASGHGGEPGLHRREAARLLQVERVEEEEAAERGERGDGDDDRRRERDRAEEPQVDQRLLAAGLVEEQADERRAAAANAARITGEVQPRLGASMIPNVSVASSTITRTWPTGSNRRGRGARDSGTKRSVSAIAASPTGG